MSSLDGLSSFFFMDNNVFEKTNFDKQCNTMHLIRSLFRPITPAIKSGKSKQYEGLSVNPISCLLTRIEDIYFEHICMDSFGQIRVALARVGLVRMRLVSAKNWLIFANSSLMIRRLRRVFCVPAV